MRAATTVAAVVTLLICAGTVASSWFYPNYEHVVPAFSGEIWQACLVVWALFVVLNTCGALWLAILSWARARSLKHALHASLKCVENTQELLVGDIVNSGWRFLYFYIRRTCSLPNCLPTWHMLCRLINSFGSRIYALRHFGLLLSENL